MENLVYIVIAMLEISEMIAIHEKKSLMQRDFYDSGILAIS